MGQKIVITANLNKSAKTPERKDVIYQWRWDRICVTAGATALGLAALWYTLAAPANAEQAPDPEKTEQTSEQALERVQKTADERMVEKQQALEQQAAKELNSEVEAQVSKDETLNRAEVTADQRMVEQQQALEQAAAKELNSEIEQKVATESMASQPINAEDINSAQQALTEPTHSDTSLSGLSHGTKMNTDKVSRAVLTTNISAREPVDTLAQQINYTELDGKLFFFTELRGLQGTTVTHQWYFEGAQDASIPLGVHTSRYRTFSSKNITPAQGGTWRVELRDDNKQILASREFTLDAHR